MKQWIATIGMEVHAELATKTKMFCACSNDPFGSLPNTNICPICLGLPGALPVMNRKAIEYTVDLGYDVGAKIADFTKWDRKNYFYPDLPKGYQLSQYDLPLLMGGAIEFLDENSKIRRINLTRIHLEEDAGKLVHVEGKNYSLVDYNRAGVPLLELVTEPEIKSAQEAKMFCQTYQFILRRRGIAKADMEKGELRCEANVSVRKPPTFNPKVPIILGTKVEVKNLNSFRAVERAIEYEIKRQIDVLESGGKVIQETRGWDEVKQKTFVQRKKETAAGYRYFPDPDLPPVTPEALWNLKRKQKGALSYPHLMTGELKHDYKLDDKTSKLITSDANIFALWTELVDELPASDLKRKKQLGQAIKIYINFDVARTINTVQLLEIVDLVESGTISQSQVRAVITEVIENNQNPIEVVKKLGIQQISDNDYITTIINKVIDNNQTAVAKYHEGAKKVFGFLVGEAMREAQGKANPAMINEALQNRLSRSDPS